MLTIEKGIPIPLDRRTKYGAFHDTVIALEVGDSFLFTGDEKRNNAGGRLAYVKRKHPERMYTTRRVDGGVRIWRVA